MTNAPGSLAGALIHVWVDNPILARVLGILLVFAGLIGVVLGTLAGDRLLRRIPEKLFRRVVSSILLAIGIYLLATSPWTG